MIKWIIYFLVYTNVWISLGAVMIALQSYMVLGIKPNIYVCIFIFFATKLTYTFQRYVKILTGERIKSERIKWMDKYKSYVIFFMIADLLIVSYCLTRINLYNVYFTLIPAAVISFYYAWKIPFTKGLNLRNIPGIKIFLIAIVWTYIVTYFPILNENIELSFEVQVLTIANFLFILSITIPFDIRDIGLDESEKKTIPQVVGIKMSKIIAVLLLMISATLITILLPTINYGLVVGIIISGILIWMSDPEKKEIYYSFLLDGTLILVPASTWIATYSTVYIQ